MASSRKKQQLGQILYGTRANKYILISGIIFYWLFTLYLYQKSEVPVEPGDGITHYQIAHYAFKYPGNFLKHWGKPIFTLLTAPFAQLGFVGMILFNLLVFTLSSWFLYQAGEKASSRASRSRTLYPHVIHGVL